GQSTTSGGKPCRELSRRSLHWGRSVLHDESEADALSWPAFVRETTVKGCADSFLTKKLRFVPPSLRARTSKLASSSAVLAQRDRGVLQVGIHCCQDSTFRELIRRLRNGDRVADLQCDVHWFAGFQRHLLLAGLDDQRILGVVAQMEAHHLLVFSHLREYGRMQCGQRCSVDALASHQYTSQHHGASHNFTDHFSTSSRSVKFCAQTLGHGSENYAHSSIRSRIEMVPQVHELLTIFVTSIRTFVTD